MGRGRVHSREFKLEVVRQIASGAKRPAQICREYALANSVVDRWRQEYRDRGELAFMPREVTGDAALEAHIADLERLCGQLALENAALKKGLKNGRWGSGTP
jgi:transposase